MSDFNGIAQLEEEQEKNLKNCREMIEKWEKFKEEYKTVDKFLSDLPKKTTHDIMVPIGPLAFMPGQLIHTNEIMVYLGENWFAERSATQAMEIVQRRLGRVDEYLGNLHKEHENILSHMNFTKSVFDPGGQNREIVEFEELTDEDKKRQDKNWRRMAHAKATKHSVKKVDFMKDSRNETKSNEEEDLFARLEELERQEEMNNELKNEEYFANSACNTKCDDETLKETHDTSRVARMKNASSDVRACSEKERAPTTCTVNEQNNSSRAVGCVFEDKRAANACPTQSEQNNASDTCNITEATNLNDSDKHLVKKVSWKENIVEKQEDGVVTNLKHGNTTIYFTHSAHSVIDPRERESGEQRQGIGSPADILPYYLNKTRIEERSEFTSKNSVDAQSSTSEVPESNQAGVTHNTKDGKEKVPQAFSDVVIEHNDVPRGNASTEDVKEQKTERKISKFKAGRMKNN